VDSLITFLNTTGKTFINFSTPMLIQSSVLIVVLLGLDLLLRKKVRAVFRYCIWMLVLVKLVLPTTLSLPTGLGYWFGDKVPDIVSVSPIVAQQTPAILTRTNPVSEKLPSVKAITSLPAVIAEYKPIVSMPAESIIPAPLAAVSLSWQGLAFLGWLAAVIAMVLLLIQRIFLVRSLLTQSKDSSDSMIDIFKQCCKQMGLRRAVSLKLSPIAASPAVCGLFRPTILIPENILCKLKDEDLKSILLHEIAHVKRGDLYISLVQTILQIAYFYNPLTWVANAIIRRVREQAVDEMVLVAMGEEAGDYPETLLNVYRMTLPRPALSLRLIGVVESKNALSSRIKHILSRPFPKSAKVGIAGLLCVIVMAAVLLPMAKAQTEKDAAELESSQETSIDREIPNTVSGVVTDEVGRFRSHVSISESGKRFSNKVQTDMKGHFTIENIKPEQKVWVANSHHCQTMGIFAIPEDYDGQRLHVILNYSNATISGRVVDGNGAGLADKQIELIFKTKEGLTLTIPGYSKTDKYGVYEFSDMPCGAGLEVQAKVIDTDENEYITEPLTLDDDQLNAEMPSLIIGQGQYAESEDGRVLYSGRVLNEQNAPISGAVVGLMYDWGGRMSRYSKKTKTDSQGRWSKRLPVDLSNLSTRLLHQDYLSFHFVESSRKAPKAEFLDGSNIMAMKDGLRIEGTVLTADGKAVENALIAAGGLYSSRSGRIIEDCTTDRTAADGSFSIGGLPQREVDLVISAIGYASMISYAEVSKDMEPVEIILKKGRVYRGQIVDEDGNPLEGIEVKCHEWTVDGKRRQFSALTKTDSQGMFSVSDVPVIGTLSFVFGRSRNPLLAFYKQMPEYLSAIDKMTMYPVPVVTAKVIDAETREPIKKFTIVQGCKWESTDEEPSWSTHHKNMIDSEDGSFEQKWGGFGISYPFDGAIFMKIVAEGYYSESTPAVELGKRYDSFVIELSKSQRLIGNIFDPDGNPANKAEIGWVGPGKKAFIKNGKFNRGGFTHQAETIVTSGKTGHFSMNPEREDALIVVMHERGYSQIKSTDFQQNGKIKLSPWSKIEVTFDHSESEKKSEIRIMELTTRDSVDTTPRIYWMFDSLTTTKDSLTVEHIPAIPLHIAKNLRYELHNAKFFEARPGETHKIDLRQKGNTAKGKIRLSDSPLHDFVNPRQTHVVAFRINGESTLPEKFKNLSRSSFSWLLQDQVSVYPASKTYQSRFIPTIDSQGNFSFDKIPAGEYELVINLHDPLGQNVSCGRGVLRSAAVIKFTIEKQQSTTQIPPIDLKSLIYPGSGEIAPLFEAKTFDGKVVSLTDCRGKIVLLDFWGTWCRPCVQQMPKIKKVYEAFKNDENFVMLGMNLDWDLKKAENYITAEKINWPQLSLGSMSESDIVKNYGIGGVPALILIGSDGKIISKNLNAEQLQAAIAQAINSK